MAVDTEAEMSSDEVGSSNTAELGLMEKSVDTLERSIMRLEIVQLRWPFPPQLNSGHSLPYESMRVV